MRFSSILALASPALVVADGFSDMLNAYTAISSTDTAAFYNWLSNYAQMAESYYSYDSGSYATGISDTTGTFDYSALASETSAAASLISELESAASETGFSEMSAAMSGMTMSSGSVVTSAASARSSESSVSRSSGSSGSSRTTNSAASSGAASSGSTSSQASQVSSQSSSGLGNRQAPMIIGAALAGVSILLL